MKNFPKIDWKNKEIGVILFAIIILFLISQVPLNPLPEQETDKQLGEIKFPSKYMPSITGLTVEDIYEFIIPNETQEENIIIPSENETTVEEPSTNGTEELFEIPQDLTDIEIEIPPVEEPIFEIPINETNISEGITFRDTQPSIKILNSELNNGNWIITFNTTGIANLTITPTNGTTWTNKNETADLKLLELNCGSNPINYKWINDSIFIEDYQCNETGYKTSEILTEKNHNLEFKFGTHKIIIQSSPGFNQQEFATHSTTISACATLSIADEEYLLDSDIPNDDGTCFTIGATGITFDCQGHTIDGDADPSGYGIIINNANYDDLTIKNCIIQEFARNLYVGANSDNIRIENSSLLDGYYDGILTYSTDNMYIVNSTFTGVTEYGAYFTYSGTNENNNWTIINSTFRGGTTTSDYGARLRLMANVTIKESNFTGGAAASSYGLYVEMGENVTVVNNTIHSPIYIGLRFHRVNNSRVQQNNLTSGTSYGFYFADYNNRNKIENNLFSGAYAMYQAYSDNNTFVNNNFTSTTQYTYMRYSNDYNNYSYNNFSSTTHGIYLRDGSEHNDFIGNKITTSSDYGVYFLHSNNNTRFINNNISGGTYGLYLSQSAISDNIKIINNEIESSTDSIYLLGANNATIENNTIIGTQGRLVLNRVYNSTIKNQEFRDTQALSQTLSDNNVFENNNFTSTTSYTYITYSNNNNYTDNNFTSTSSYGMWLRYDSKDNNFVDNDFISGTNYGAYIREDCLRNNFTTNRFISGTSFGARFYDNNDNNIIYYNNFSSGNNWALYFDNGNDNNIFKFNNFSSTNAGALAILTRSSNNILDNNSFYGDASASDDAVYIATSSNNNTISNSTLEGNRYGLYINNADNNKIENNKINASVSDAIYLYFTTKGNVINNNVLGAPRYPIYMLYGAQYNNITNNYLKSDTSFFYLNTACDNNVIENNTIASGTADADYGIYVAYSDGNKIINNNITSGDYGIYSYSSSDHVIDSNNISVAAIAGSYGIYMDLFSNNNNITNNEILSRGDDNIRIRASLGNIIKNNTLCDSDDYGIYIYEGSEENEIIENTICSNTDDGIYILSSNDNEIVSNNISSNTNGITLIDSIWNKIEKNNIFSNSAIGLNIGDGSTGGSTFANGELIDTTISDSGTNDIVLVASTINAINLSFDEAAISIDADSSAIFNWWVDVNVTDTITQVPSATVNIYDNNTNFIVSSITDASGYIAKLNLTEYYQDSTDKIYYSNYTFNTSATNYFDATDSLNVSTNSILDILLLESLPPVLQSISLNPSDQDNIDPNIEINVTANVTDYIAVDTVILQYKEDNNTLWSNSSMVYNSNTLSYENGLFTPINNNTWNYRIWANDTYGSSNFSEYFNVNVQYDYTWNRSPLDFGTIIGIIDTTGPIGTLTINNTGDFNLTIDLSSTWDDTTYNLSEPFNIAPKENITIGINVTFDDDITDIDSVISTTASNDNEIPSPLQLNTSVEISSYTGGPYLILTLDTYPTTAKQTSIQTLKSKIQNLAKYADETVFNITLNWSLPPGWSLLTGNISSNFSNLTAQSIEWANLSLIVGTSAPYDENGTNTTISVSVISDSDTSDALSQNVILLCNGADGVCGEGCWDDVDSDCLNTAPITSGGGSTGGAAGGGAAGGSSGQVSTERALQIKESSETVEVLKGESNFFNIDIANIYPNSVLKDITLKVEGFLEQYLTIKPITISQIIYQGKDKFTVYIDTPKYLSFGIYQLEATIEGNLVKGQTSQKIVEKRTINLVVHEIKGEVALEAISKGEQIITEMEKEGFATKLISWSLNEARNAFENKQYKQAKDIIDGLIEKKDRAYEAKTLMKDVEKRIEDAKKEGLDVSTTEKLYTLALAAFDREDYETAAKNLKEAQLTELLETKGRINILKAIINHWLAILISLLGLSVVTTILYKKIHALIIKYKIFYLNKEEENVISLIKEAQRGYYVKKEIDFANFSKTIEQYGLRIAKIRQKRLELISKRMAALTAKLAKRRMESERRKILKDIKLSQKGYFVENKLGQAEYATVSRINQERLVELDKNLEILASRIEKERGSFWSRTKNMTLNILHRASTFNHKERKSLKERRKIEKDVENRIKKELKKRLKNEKK